MTTKDLLVGRLVALIDQHSLWDEVQRYSGWDRERLTTCTTLITSDFNDICYGASVHPTKIYDGVDVVVSPLAWQRELDRRVINYRSVAGKPLEVRLSLTPEDWCGLYQREGTYHVGDLGAKNSSVQATVDQMFRDDGWIAVSTLAELAYVVAATPTIGWDHYFEDSSLLQKPYYTLSPPQKLVVIWHIVKEFGV